jgi:predicted transcriptional regulator
MRKLMNDGYDNSHGRGNNEMQPVGFEKSENILNNFFNYIHYICSYG